MSIPLLAATPPTLARQTGVCMGKERSKDFELSWRRSEHLRHNSTTRRSPLPMLGVNGRRAPEQALMGQPQDAEAPVSLLKRRGIAPPKPIEVRVRERQNLLLWAMPPFRPNCCRAAKPPYVLTPFGVIRHHYWVICHHALEEPQSVMARVAGVVGSRSRVRSPCCHRA